MEREKKIDLKHETAKYLVSLMESSEKSPEMVAAITRLLYLVISDTLI